MLGGMFRHPTDGGGIKLVRTRSGNLQAPGLLTNETALGALAMALLVFQGEYRCKPRPVKAHGLQRRLSSFASGPPILHIESYKLFHAQRRHSTVADAAVLADAGGAALPGLCRRHLHRGHQAGAVLDSADAAMPVSKGACPACQDWRPSS